MFQTCCRENFIFNNSPPPPRKSCLFWENVDKYCWVRQATDDNMTHAHCVLDNSGYKHILRICNSYRFSTPTTVTRMCLIFTLHIRCLSYQISKGVLEPYYLCEPAVLNGHEYDRVMSCETNFIAEVGYWNMAKAYFRWRQWRQGSDDVTELPDDSLCYVCPCHMSMC